jgi:hypothetical protein
MLQITAVAPAGAGSIAISGASVVDFAAGQTVSNVDVVKLAGDGTASLTVMGASSNVTVDLVSYFSGDLIVPGSTKVLSATLLAAIVNLGSDLTITFAAGTQVSPPIGLNDVIAAHVSPTTPHGFLRRVLAISTNSSGQVVLGTRIAKIPEAMTSFSIEWVMPPIGGTFGMSHGAAPGTLAPAAPLRSTSPFPPPPGTSIDPRYPSFFFAKPGVGRIVVDLSTVGLGQSELDINSLEIQALPNFQFSGNPFLGQTIHLNVGFSVAARAAVVLQLLGSVDLMNQIIFKFPEPFQIGAPVEIPGPVPIEFELQLDVRVTFTLRINGGIDFGYNVDRYGAVSGGYDGTNFFIDQPVYHDYLTPTQAVTIQPDVQEQAELDVHLIPSIAFYGGVGTIGVDVRPYLRATVTPLSNPWWEVSAGICRSLVLELNLVLFDKTAEFPPVCLEFILLTAPGPKLTVTISPSSATVTRSATTHFGATVAGSGFGVTWSIKEGSAGGSLSNASELGVDYTAPRKAGTYHLVGAAIEDSTSTAAAAITVPAVVPSQPLNVSAVLASKTSASVGWSPPSDDGGAALSGYQVTVSPGGATINTNAATTTTTALNLTPNTTYTFTVTATNGAGLTSAPSAASAPITTPPAGPMSVTPTALDFGTVPKGQTSQPKTVTVTAGGAQLVVGTVALSGTQAANFSIQSDLCSGTTVAAGASCTFAVVYKPATQGPVSASVKIPDDDKSSPQTVTLAGSSPVPTTPGVGRVADLQMIDLQHGFLVDSHGVMATVDGGTTWVRQVMPADVQFFGGGQLGLPQPGSLHFVDTNDGWALACRPTTTPCTPLVIGTSDGGNTWQDLGSLPTGVTANVMWFADLQNGWVFGSTLASKPAGFPGIPGANALFATIDGGRTWNQQTLPDPLAGPSCPVLDEGRLSSEMRFFDANNGWVLGGASCSQSTIPFSRISGAAFAWTTANGGATWTAHQMPADLLGASTPVQLLSPSQMRVEGVTFDNGFYDNVIIATDDGGNTFSKIHIPLQANDLEFVDATHAIGVNSTRPDVFTTSDGGTTWSDISIIPDFQDPTGQIQTANYHTLKVVDANNMWVSGTAIYFNAEAGFVSHSSDGGLTWTVQLLGDGT